MGNDQSGTTNSREFTELMTSFVKEMDSDNSHFGKIAIYQEIKNAENRIFTKQFNAKTEKDFNSFFRHFQRRKKISHPHIIGLLAVKNNNESKLCGDNGSWLAAFDFFCDTLKDEVQKRQQTRAPYSESHMWLLAAQLVDPCFYLEQQELIHGDIRPQNVFLDENGFVRVYVNLLFTIQRHQESTIFPGTLTGYQKYVTLQEPVFLSPEQLDAARASNFDPKINKSKADVFALGMTLLESATLQCIYLTHYYHPTASLECYDFSGLTINWDLVKQRLSSLRLRGYSPVLTNFVRELLRETEDQRPSFADLSQVIDKFRTQINNLQPFYNKQTPSPRRQPQQQQLPMLTSAVQQPIFPINSMVRTFSPRRVNFAQPQQSLTRSFIPPTINPPVLLQSSVSKQFAFPTEAPQYQSYQPQYYSQAPPPMPQIQEEQQQQPNYFQPQVQPPQIYSIPQPQQSNPQQFDIPQPPPQQPQQQLNEDLDQRVQRALQLSQEAINRHATNTLY